MATPSVQINDWLFVPDSPIGVTVGYNQVHDTDPQLFKDMAAAGMSRVRINAVMDNIVTAKPTDPISGWTWGFLDSAIAMANAAGLRVTLIARGLSPTQSAWSVVSPCSPGYYPTAAPNYAVIAVAMAQRYSGDGNPANAKDPNTGKKLQVDCIEIGNEEFNSMPDPSPAPLRRGVEARCVTCTMYGRCYRSCVNQLHQVVATGCHGATSWPGLEPMGMSIMDYTQRVPRPTRRTSIPS